MSSGHQKALETSLWTWLKRARKSPSVSLERIENLVGGGGMADVIGAWRMHVFFIELKTVARPKRTSTKIRPKFQPGQPKWLTHWYKVHGAAFILLQVGSGHGATRFLLPGTLAAELARGEYTEEQLHHVSMVKSTARPIDVLDVARRRR